MAGVCTRSHKWCKFIYNMLVILALLHCYNQYCDIYNDCDISVDDYQNTKFQNHSSLVPSQTYILYTDTDIDILNNKY